MRSRLPAIVACVALGPAGLLCGQTEPPAPPAPASSAVAPGRVTFDEAVGRALQENANVREAAQAILRAQALLQQARAAVLPSSTPARARLAPTRPAASTAR